MDKLKQMPNPDIIFVGAGINSLGAALLLCEAGWKVLVLDRNATPGGAIRTMELTLPGFKHDIGAMNLNTFVGSPFYKKYAKALSRKGFETISADYPNGTMTNDGDFLGVSTNLDQNLESIAQFSSKDALAWKQWRADFSAYSPPLFQMLGSPAAHSDPLDLILGSERKSTQKPDSAMQGILFDSLRKNLTARFESDAVQSLIASWGMHLDYAPEVAGGCWMPFIETNVDELAGISLGKGGSGQLINALAALIQEAGGLVVTNMDVEEIEVKNDAVRGVRLATGQRIACSGGVVASVTPQALVKLTKGHLPPAFVKQANNFRYGPGTLVLHLALSEAAKWTAAGARRSFYVHIAPSLDYLDSAYQQSMAGMLPSDPICVIGQPTLYDPSRAPPGQHVMWVMVRGVPAEICGDAAGTISGKTWDKEVTDAFAERVLNKIEELAPGFRTTILATNIVNPIDLQTLNPNLVGGDLTAGSMHLAQFYGNRPIPNFAEHVMPIAGLYMCGASTWPGGGAFPGSGVLLAQKLLEEFDVKDRNNH